VKYKQDYETKLIIITKTKPKTLEKYCAQLFKFEIVRNLYFEVKTLSKKKNKYGVRFRYLLLMLQVIKQLKWI